MLRAATAVSALALAAATPLDDYVNKPDDNYSWTDTGVRLNGTNLNGDLSWEGYVLNMTSQQWLTPEDTDRSLWWHMQVMIVPSSLDADNDWGVVWCTGGSNGGNPIPSASDEDIQVAAYVAMQTGSISSALFQVPNERMVFSSDPTQQSRTEDAIIAYGWSQYLDGADAEWIPQLPMAKAGVRGIDTMIDWAQKEKGMELNHIGFAGASKRGWTTWLVAAVDDRVDAFAPVVMDLLNTHAGLKLHQQSLGGWSFAFEDYYDMNITARIDEPRTQDLFAIVDPLAYKERYAGRPKMVCDATGDEFFLLTDWLNWMDQMPGPMHQVMSPNTEHTFITGVFELLPSVSAYFDAIKRERTLPEIEWSINNSTGEVTMQADTQPIRVNAWHATSCAESGMRDFRLASAISPCRPCGLEIEDMCIQLSTLWSVTQLDHTQEKWSFVLPQDEDGSFTAFFIDAVFAPEEAEGLEWPVDHPGNYEFSTGVSVIAPAGMEINEFPFPECHDEGCKLTLV